MAPLHNLCSQIKNAYGSKLRRIAVPFSKTNMAVADILYKQGFITAYMQGNKSGPNSDPITPLNIAQTRVWIDLKYRLGEPALHDMALISKPSRKIYANVDELRNVFAASCKRTSLLKNSRFGQVTIVKTEDGIMDLKDALLKGQGGQVLCYAR